MSPAASWAAPATGSGAAERSWAPDVALGLVVLAVGGWEATKGLAELDVVGARVQVLVAVAMACAVTLHRQRPPLALLLVWVAGSIQALSLIDVMFVQLGTLVVAFGCARYGSRVVLSVSGVSIPLGAVVAAVYVLRHGTMLVHYAGRLGLPLPTARGLGPATAVPAGLVAVALLAAPWFAGLALRARWQAEQSREQQVLAEDARTRAQELAALRAEQTRLARDVHDVVGHSLAVILAQAESAQFLADDDPARMKQTMRNIATSARQSLQDVRHVLSSTQESRDLTTAAGLDGLVDGVREADNDVRSTVVGHPWVLPEELDVVAFRVLQEMLTNALKHGVRGGPVHVEQHWDTLQPAGDRQLRLEVRNAVARGVPADSAGLGLDGMRRRLASVGGRLDTRRCDEDGTETYAATAWVPLSTVPAAR